MKLFFWLVFTGLNAFFIERDFKQHNISIWTGICVVGLIYAIAKCFGAIRTKEEEKS